MPSVSDEIPQYETALHFLLTECSSNGESVSLSLSDSIPDGLQDSNNESQQCQHLVPFLHLGGYALSAAINHG